MREYTRDNSPKEKKNKGKEPPKQESLNYYRRKAVKVAGEIPI